MRLRIQVTAASSTTAPSKTRTGRLAMMVLPAARRVCRAINRNAITAADVLPRAIAPSLSPGPQLLNSIGASTGLIAAPLGAQAPPLRPLAATCARSSKRWPPCGTSRPNTSAIVASQPWTK